MNKIAFLFFKLKFAFNSFYAHVIYHIPSKRYKSRTIDCLRANQYSLKPHKKRQLVFIICGFGDLEYFQAASRLASSLTFTYPNSHVFLYSKLEQFDSIDSIYVESLKKLIKTYPQGFGLWAWKPLSVLNTLLKCKDEDEIFYLDAGCEFSSDGCLTFDLIRHYNILNSSIFFHLPFSELLSTAPSVFNFFGGINTSSFQIQATWFGLINTPLNVSLVTDWAYLCTHKSSLLLTSNLDYHRHDQSILSCLIKANYKNIHSLPQIDHFPKYMYTKSSWIYEFPVHSLRNYSSSSSFFACNHSFLRSRLHVFWFWLKFLISACKYAINIAFRLKSNIFA